MEDRVTGTPWSIVVSIVTVIARQWQPKVWVGLPFCTFFSTSFEGNNNGLLGQLLGGNVSCLLICKDALQQSLELY